MTEVAKKATAKRLLWSVIRIVVATYVGAILVGLLFQNRLIYFPLRDIEQTPKDVGLAFEEVELTTSDGVKLSAWYVPAAEKGGRTFVFCHGNGGNIGHRLDKLAIFYRLGVNVLIFDYRGYGKSAGKPSENGTYADAEAAYDWVRGV
jgi:uncharacterized protein